MKTVLVPLATGFEEIEAITIIDILRRAGATVITAGLEKRNVVGSHDIHLLADSVLAEEMDKDWDLVVLPGGVPGTPNLLADERIIKLIRNHNSTGKLIGAICAAPAVLEKAGLLADKPATIHPAWAEKLDTAKYTGARVEMADKIITGKSAGTAMEFAFKLVEQLFGAEKVAEINQGVFARL